MPPSDSLSLSLSGCLSPVPQELWRAATITKETTDGDKQMCVCLTCDDDPEVEITVERGDLLLRDVLPPEGVDDLVSLGNLHAPAILDNLRLRFMKPPEDTGRHKSICEYYTDLRESPRRVGLEYHSKT